MDEATKKKFRKALVAALKERQDQLDQQQKKEQISEKNEQFYLPKEEILITPEDVEKIRKYRRMERNFGSKKLSLLEKRGICVYIHNLTNISAVLKKLFDLFKGKAAQEKSGKLSREEWKIADEVAAYFHFITVNQIWGLHSWGLSKDDAYMVLDTATSYLFNVFHIANHDKKLKEYRNMIENGIESSLGHLSENIINIVKEDIRSRVKPILIQGIVRNQLISHFLGGLKQISNFSEPEMDAEISDFKLDFPHFV